MKDPIIVTGCPRSRTSLVMQILELSGMFLGKVLQETKANPQGQKENTEVITKVVKPELRKFGYDPKGQNPVPNLDFCNIDPSRRDRVFEILKRQGLENQTWGIKLCKAIWNHKGWIDSFPNSAWVIVRRNDRHIIKSCMSPKASFMDKYNTPAGWQEWINKHKERFELLKKESKKYFEIDTDKLVNGDLTGIENIIKSLGLNWDEDKIRSQIRP